MAVWAFYLLSSYAVKHLGVSTVCVCVFLKDRGKCLNSQGSIESEKNHCFEKVSSRTADLITVS